MWVAGLGALAVALYSMKGLGQPLLGHDVYKHLVRIAQWHQAVEDGVYYPRFFRDVFWGHGGPMVQYPLPYCLTEIFSSAGAGPSLALSLGMALGMAAGPVAMYFLARPSLGTVGAAMAAAAYALVPYRLLNAYVRIAYGEILGAALLPALLIAARRLAESPRAGAAAGAALCTGLLILTHGPSVPIGLPLAAAYGLWCAPPGARLSRALPLGAAMAAGVGLAAFYWIPFIAERPATKLVESLQGFYEHSRHFVWLRQLFETRWGFGPSVEGPNDGMSFQLGVVHVAAALGGLGVAVWGSGAARREVRFWLAAAGAAVFLMLEVSAPVWRAVPVLPWIQFPWRLLGLTAIGTSLCAGALATLLPRRSALAQAGLAAGLAVALLWAYGPFVVSRPGRGIDARVTPETLAHQPGEDGIFMPLRARPEPPPSPRVSVVAGQARAEVLSDRTHRLVARVRAEGPATVRVRIFDYPGWQAAVDGTRVPHRTDDWGAILVDVPGGEHELTLTFEFTWPRRLGAWVSGLVLLLGAAVSAGWWRRSRLT